MSPETHALQADSLPTESFGKPMYTLKVKVFEYQLYLHKAIIIALLKQKI